MNPELESVPKILESMRAALAGLQAAHSDSARADQLRRYMDGLFQLGLTIARDPALRRSPEVVALLQESASTLSRAIPDIAAYLRATEYKLHDTWYLDEWTGVSMRRSSLELLRELYRDTSLAGDLSQLDLEDLDDMLRQRGQGDGHLPDEKIPPGVPPLHWWWWYPREPPKK